LSKQEPKKELKWTNIRVSKETKKLFRAKYPFGSEDQIIRKYLETRPPIACPFVDLSKSKLACRKGEKLQMVRWEYCEACEHKVEGPIVDRRTFRKIMDKLEKFEQYRDFDQYSGETPLLRIEMEKRMRSFKSHYYKERRKRGHLELDLRYSERTNDGLRDENCTVKRELESLENLLGTPDLGSGITRLKRMENTLQTLLRTTDVITAINNLLRSRREISEESKQPETWAQERDRLLRENSNLRSRVDILEASNKEKDSLLLERETIRTKETKETERIIEREVPRKLDTKLEEALMEAYQTILPNRLSRLDTAVEILREIGLVSKMDKRSPESRWIAEKL